MLNSFSDLIFKVTGLTSSDDKIIYAVVGCFLFLCIINGIVGLCKNLMNVWR